MRKFLRLSSLTPSKRHHAVLRLVGRALRDDRGGEVLEYAIVAGLVVVGAIAAVTCVGQKVLARWSSINTPV